MTPRSKLRADTLRDIPLERVATALGYRRSRRDPAKWKRPGSILSINGAKFYDHLAATGGGGAIDLVLFAGNCSFLQALETLAEIEPPPRAGNPFRERLDPTSWPNVREYLTRQRSLDPAILDRCFQQHILGADLRSNAVFLVRDARNKPVGAELRGTRPGPPFHGMAPGSRKACGGFWIARQKQPRTALIVESAIDALSSYQITSTIHIVLSTAGLATSLPPWINAFNLQKIACGYDADHGGDQAARRLIQTNPNITRSRPRGHSDWNDCLRASEHAATHNQGADTKR